MVDTQPGNYYENKTCLDTTINSDPIIIIIKAQNAIKGVFFCAILRKYNVKLSYYIRLFNITYKRCPNKPKTIYCTRSGDDYSTIYIDYTEVSIVSME
jgi:hypothetical protein